ncbi:MAG TPA: T9SS type A sorting domain-containing protein, partial [Hymenobacter sp.]|nr:T9SS type A sorting domain-containing protein [Hymenobacter sp.]
GTGQAGTVTPGTINPGVWRTTNGGTSFTQVADLPTTGLQTGHRYDPLNCFIERDAVQANVRYFIARDVAFYRSTNGGTNWSARTHPFNQQAWAWDLHADPVRSENLWAAGDFAGVKVSRNGGQSWTSTAQYMNARFVASCDGKIAVFGKKDGDAQPRLYYSTDDGATFNPLTTPTRNFHGVQGLAVDRAGKVWVSWNSVTVVTPSGTVTSTSAAPARTTSSIHLYPNPATGSFRVSTATDGATITVTTLTGQVVRTVTASGKTTMLEAGSWPAGLYLVRVQAGPETTIKKVVIAH